jgi:hypothetical protein
MTQTLTCQNCGTSWTRNAQRGRKPKLCTNCQPKAAYLTNQDDASVETLICQHGNHEWTRPKARGRKPPLCPEHRLTQVDETAKVISLPSVDIRPALVQTILDGPRTELQRKLEYTVAQLENPGAWREQADWNSLIYTHKRLIQEAARELNAPRPTPILDEEAA